LIPEEYSSWRRTGAFANPSKLYASVRMRPIHMDNGALVTFKLAL
jgi:hypothetical protein